MKPQARSFCMKPSASGSRVSIERSTSSENTGRPDFKKASSGLSGYSCASCHSGRSSFFSAYHASSRPLAHHGWNMCLNRLLLVVAPTHRLWNRLPSPLAVERAMTRPPTSAMGSIDAHASSELGRYASSSTTARYTDSPRAGSEADGSDSMYDSLVNSIFVWVWLQMGPRHFIHSGRKR